jgi:hypothetical protein
MAPSLAVARYKWSYGELLSAFRFSGAAAGDALSLSNCAGKVKKQERLETVVA